MSIQPIDLQTLFLRLSQVGREQQAIQQSISQSQDVAGEEIAKHSHDVGEMVTRAEDVSDGPEAVDDEHGNPREREKGHGRSGDDADPDDAEEIFRDPDLGQHIDLTG